MNKKGNLVMVFIVGVLAVVLLVYCLFPQVKGTTNTATATEEYTHAGPTANLTLASYPIVSSSLSIENLTTSNYTLLDANTGLVSFNNTAGATYTINYTYYPTGYLTNSADRTLMGLVVLAGILGLVAWLFAQFGLTDR